MEMEDGTLRHSGFLADDNVDPRRAFAESLITAMAGSGPVLVYTLFEPSYSVKDCQARPTRLAQEYNSLVTVS
jgi:hypothetical protein